jgi:hypothetical protein
VLPVLVLLVATVQADTIHLKNGSVLKGKVTSFADDQFTVLIDTGSGRYLSRATVYVGDVASVQFDSAAGPGDAGPASETGPAPTIESKPSNTGETRPPETGEQPTAQPKEPEAQPTRTDVEAPKESATQPKDSSASTEPAAAPPEPAPEPEKPSRKSLGPVRTVSVDVVGKRDWTSSGLIVKRGDRLRITASGEVTLDPSTGKTSGPEGVDDLTDPKKLMPDQPTGALIGVIGADNDDFIFIGKSAEFTAVRDGLLFLSVNEGVLTDNSGTYRASIELQSSRKQ